LERPPAARARRDVNKILTGARRAAELTQQMLAYSGRGRFATELLGLSELVEEMAHLLQVSIPKRCRLACELGDDLPGIEADPGQVRQVVMNLLLNAAEAVGDAGGLITVRTRVRECDRRFLTGCALGKEIPEGPYVALEVTDSGCGIDGEVMGKIFEPFFTTKFTGRGLGLAAVLGIVRGHHGAISVASEPGQGTTFQVLFPAARAAAEAPAREAGLGEWRGAGTLLLVDDEPAVRSLAREMLERLGFAVRCAAGGRGALRTLRANTAGIRAVVLDESVPDMDALELLRALRGLRPDLPVVLASTQGAHAVRRRYADEGLAGCVQKPFLMDELRAAVRGAVER
jgi:CheY-like chemotaxis protein